MSKAVQRFSTITLADGTKKRIAARGKTEKEALKKLSQLEAEYKTGQRVLSGEMTVKQWAEVWAETYKKPAVTNKTYNQMIQILHNIFITDIGHMKLQEVKKTNLQTCLNSLQGKSDSYINKARQYAAALFRAAADEGLIVRNPAAQLTAPKGTHKERRALTDEERKLFLQVIPSKHYGAYFGIMLACGLRPGEARALTYDCINYKDMTVTVYQAVESGTKDHIKAPKSSAGVRTVPLPDWYADILRKQPRHISGRVFETSAGKPIGEQSHRRMWSWLINAMNIAAGAKTHRNQIIEPVIDESLTAYYLRHTYATNLAEIGVDIKTAQYLLGHSDIQMTAKIYTHVTTKMLDDARNKINTLQQNCNTFDKHLLQKLNLLIRNQ